MTSLLELFSRPDDRANSQQQAAETALNLLIDTPFAAPHSVAVLQPEFQARQQTAGAKTLAQDKDDKTSHSSTGKKHENVEKPGTEKPAQAEKLAAHKPPERTTTVNKDGSRTIHNTDGSTADIDANGYLTKISRKDGSSIACQYYTNGALYKLTESSNGNTAEWTRDNNTNRWISMAAMGVMRINLSANDQGKMSFEDVPGNKITINGDNTVHLTSPAATEVNLANGKVTSVNRKDGSSLRCTFTKDGKPDTITESDGKTTRTWKHDGKNGAWTAKGTDELRYQYNVAANGNAAYVTAHKDNVVHAQYADGTKRDFRYKDGTLHSVTEETKYAGKITWTRDGATDTWKSGQNKETRTHVAVTPDGDYSFVDDKGYKHVYKYDQSEEKILSTSVARSKETARVRDSLIKTADGQITDKNRLAWFKHDLDTFERRCQSAQVNEQYVQRAMTEVQELLKSTVQNPTITGGDRTKLAEQALHHLAYPRSIDQGMHATCGATTAEILTATKRPDCFAWVIKQVADTGQFRTMTGNTVIPDSTSLQPDFQARKYEPYSTASLGDRSYASQLFQVATINAAFQGVGWASRYEQRRPTDAKDTGEYAWDWNTGVVNHFTGMPTHVIQELTNQVMGERVTVLERGQQFNTADDLKNQLLFMQKNGQLPCILGVHLKNEPFWTEGGAGRSGLPPGGHVVTVWDIDANGLVLMDNQWSKRSDRESLRRLPYNTLFGATAK